MKIASINNVMWCVWISIRYVTIDSRTCSRGVFFIHSSSHFRMIVVWFLYGILDMEWGQFTMKKNMRSKSTLHAFNKMLPGITIWYAKYVLYIQHSTIILKWATTSGVWIMILLNRMKSESRKYYNNLAFPTDKNR